MAFTIGPHHATSTTPSKVNSFHTPPSFGYHVNGILLDTRANAMTRTMTMTPRGDDKRTPEIKTPKKEAWKRRRKKLLKLDRSLRSISGPTPKPAPRTVRMPLRRRHRRLTGVSVPDRSLRPSHRSLRTKCI